MAVINSPHWVSCRNLAIDITTKCNLCCPWCIGPDKSDNAVWSEGVYLRFLDHITAVSYDMYSFHGGESTLYPDAMFNVMDRIREVNPQARLKLFTNGTLLTDSIVDRLNERAVDVCLSLNQKGYKSLDTFILNSVNPACQFNVVKRLTHLCVRAVATRKTLFTVEALILHNIFNCIVETMPDYTTLKDWDEGDLEHISKELTLLQSVDKTYQEWHILPGGFCDHECDCPHATRHFYVDGTLGRGAYSSGRCIQGCAMFADQMGDKLYAQYQALWSRFYERENKECLTVPTLTQKN